MRMGGKSKRILALVNGLCVERRLLCGQRQPKEGNVALVMTREGIYLTVVMNFMVETNHCNQSVTSEFISY